MKLQFLPLKSKIKKGKFVKLIEDPKDSYVTIARIIKIEANSPMVVVRDFYNKIRTLEITQYQAKKYLVKPVLINSENVCFDILSRSLKILESYKEGSKVPAKGGFNRGRNVARLYCKHCKNYS